MRHERRPYEHVSLGRTRVHTAAPAGQTGDDKPVWGTAGHTAVGFRYNAERDTIDIGGTELEKSRMIQIYPVPNFIPRD